VLQFVILHSKSQVFIIVQILSLLSSFE